MNRRLRPLPDGLGNQFTTDDARRLGVAKSRLRGRDLERPFRGVYRVRDDDEQVGEAAPSSPKHPSALWRERQLKQARALAAYLPPGYFFCGRTAATIWQLPSPPGADDRVEVACFSPARALRLGGVNASRVDAGFADTVVRDGLPVTDAATTWCMLAPKLAWNDGIALGDAVIRRARIPGTQCLKRAPYATLDDLECAASVSYRRGRTALMRMLPLLSPHSASAPESHLRLALAEWGAPDPALDFDVYGRGGRLLGCSEIAFPEYRVAHEYEGDHHRTGTAQWNRDIQKYSDYRREGWEVIRVTADLLYRKPHELRAQTFELLVERGWGR